MSQFRPLETKETKAEGGDEEEKEEVEYVLPPSIFNSAVQVKSVIEITKVCKITKISSFKTYKTFEKNGKVIDLECGVLECRKHIARNFFLE